MRECAKERGRRIQRILCSLLVLTTIATLTTELSAQSTVDERAGADFYRGKTVRIVVRFPPGGGADIYSRLIARHVGSFIPGNPTVAVSNMPGAGSIIAGNHIFISGA